MYDGIDSETNQPNAFSVAMGAEENQPKPFSVAMASNVWWHNQCSEPTQHIQCSDGEQVMYGGIDSKTNQPNIFSVAMGNK